MVSVSSLLGNHAFVNTSRLPRISGKPADSRRLPVRPFTRSLSMVSMQGPDDPHPSEWNWLLPEPPQVPSGLSLLERALYQKARQQRALGELLKCDLIEDTDKFAVTANLPGLIEDDINIEIDMELRALMISASMLQEYNHEEGIEGTLEGTFHIRERTAGTLQRSFILPKTADLEVKAMGHLCCVACPCYERSPRLHLPLTPSRSLLTAIFRMVSSASSFQSSRPKQSALRPKKRL